MNTCTESIFASIARKLNDRGITLHRNGEVEHSDGTVTYDTDAALIYHDGGEKYVVVKTVHGYEVWNGNSRVAWGDHEEHVDIVVDDIFYAVAGPSLFPLADWQQEVANDDTRLGYREWVEDRVGETAHDRLVATKRP